MALFQSSVLKKYIKGLEPQKIEEAYKKYTDYFNSDAIIQNFRIGKEEQLQYNFLENLFDKVLGFKIFPKENHNLTTEYKNLKGAKKADGAIIKEGKAIGVIELKSTKTKDLSKITDQAFGYKNHHPNCTYVITSNFEKLRFYIDNVVEFEEFNIFQLTKERFKLLWLCLSKDYIFKDLPKKIKEESLIQEEKITKELYKDYSLFRNELFASLAKNNPKYDKLTLFNKTQKLLDRFLFLFFAEDRLLLPPNSIRIIVNQWTDLRDKYDAYQPLYDRFKQFFGYMNTGRKDQQHDIFAYNGGLFKSDEILDNIKIDDDLLYKHTQKLSAYNFESEVSVNILGHIFEHSLNEIEEIQAELEGIETDKKKSKRKKDGVFYTPKYITKYIVDNTVGKLCEEKKTELGIDEAQYEKERKGRRTATLKALKQKLEDYRNWLLQITICDPACGSGAFLNQALEFLISEHRYIDGLQTKLLGGGFVFPNVENAILENNLYGVDINEESVEIAKLSLWLRTAQKGRKLTSLNDNIKCGNSLIDDPEVAGDKAFNWEAEFPKVFEKGGFDVVVGNPPYVRVQTIKSNIAKESKELEKKYHSATRRYDLFVLFMEKSFFLIKDEGVVSFILPHKFLVADFGYGIREFLQNNLFISELIHFGHELVFKNVSTYTCIVCLKKESEKLQYKSSTPDSLLVNTPFDKVDLKSLDNSKWDLNSKDVERVLHKIQLNPYTLKDLSSELFQGIKNTSDKIFMLQGEIHGETFKGFSQELQEWIELECSILKPVAKGRDIKRYQELDIEYFVIYPHYFDGLKTVPLEESELKEAFPKAYNYLFKFKELLVEKKIRFKTNPQYWYSLHRARELNSFERKKIITAAIQNYPHFTIDNSNSLTDAGGYSMLLDEGQNLTYEELLPILNSKLMWFYISNTSSVYSGGYYAFNTTYLNPFPIPEIGKIKSFNFSEQSMKNISATRQFNLVLKRMQNTFTRRFKIAKLSKKLQKWHELSFVDLIDELKKVKVKLSLSEEAEWEEYFKEEKAKALALQDEVNKTDREIDRMVYELYGLMEEEIEIVESIQNN